MAHANTIFYSVSQTNKNLLKMLACSLAGTDVYSVNTYITIKVLFCLNELWSNILVLNSLVHFEPFYCECYWGILKWLELKSE